MITGISGVLNQDKPITTAKHVKVSSIETHNKSEPISLEGAKALRANTFANVTFKGTEPDIVLDPKKGINQQHLKNKTIVNDTRGNKYADVSAKFKNIADVEFISGKFGNTSAIIIPKDPKYKHLRILAIQGSELNSPQGKLEIYNEARQLKMRPSFAGKLVITTSDSCSPKSIEDSFSSFFNHKVYKPFQDETKYKNNSDMTVVIPAAGQGSRFKDATRLIGDIGKPAMPLPAKINGQNYRLVQDTLMNLSIAGVLGDDTKLEVIREKEPMGSGSILITGIKEGKIPLDKPLVMRFSDAMSDIKFEEVINDFRKNNAAAIMVGAPVDRDQAKSFAVIGLNNNKEVTGFVEKPKTDEEASLGLIKDDGKNAGKYLGSIGMFIFSPESLQWMKKEMDEKGDNIFKGNGEFDLSYNILPQLMQACKEGQIKDDQGKPLRMYTHTTESNFNDLGSAKSYLKEIKRAANGEYDIPESIQDQYKENVTKEGVVCLPGTRSDFENFCKDYNITPKGNILVSSTSIS